MSNKSYVVSLRAGDMVLGCVVESDSEGAAISSAMGAIAKNGVTPVGAVLSPGSIAEAAKEAAAAPAPAPAPEPAPGQPAAEPHAVDFEKEGA